MGKPQAREAKAKINSLDYTKIKSDYTFNKTKRQPNEWKKILANVVSNEEQLISKVH